MLIFRFKYIRYNLMYASVLALRWIEKYSNPTRLPMLAENLLELFSVLAHLAWGYFAISAKSLLAQGAFHSS
jgi:hypothetical protein